MTDGEWCPPQDLVDWLDALHNSLQALLVRAEAGSLADAEAAEAMRDVLADMPGPAGAVVSELMKRIDAGEDLAPDEAHQMVLAAVTNGDTRQYSHDFRGAAGQ